MRSFWQTLFVLSTCLVLVVAGCGGSSGGGETDTGTTGGGTDTTSGSPDLSGTTDTGTPGGPDIAGDSATPPPVDIGGGGPDVPGIDVPAPPDVPAGTAQFGDPCGRHEDCESALCWRESVGSGCTIACTADADCAQWGLQCLWLGPDQRGCGAPRMTGDPTCTSQQDCRYPFICLEELGWCGSPACRWDVDCEAGRHCNPLTRRCEDDVCAAIAQCTWPMDYCIDGVCGPPACTGDGDCPEAQVCSTVYGTCRGTPPCDSEGNCPLYNETCVDGHCVPNLCANPCENETATCDPDTGRCHLPCTSAANCAEGGACDPVRSWCYENRMPAALPRVEVGGVLHDVALTAAGAPVQLDATGSADPDGTDLTYLWTVNAVPPGHPLAPGDVLTGAVGPRALYQPPLSGVYAIGLVVVDGGGLSSYPAEVVFVVP